MNDPKTARRGVISGVVAMLMGVAGTLVEPGIVNWGWIVLALVLGFAVGVPLSRVPLTAVPQRTALSHAFGGLAAGLVGTAEYCDLPAAKLDQPLAAGDCGYLRHCSDSQTRSVRFPLPRDHCSGAGFW